MAASTSFTRQRDVVTSLLLICLLPSVARAIEVHTTDIIPDADRTNFNGFEMSGECTNPTVEDGIRVREVGEWGVYNYYCSVSNNGMQCNGGAEGARSWWVGGGAGVHYTEVTLGAGLQFQRIGMRRSTAHCPSTIFAYELWNAGVMIMAGTLPHSSDASSYVGFIGPGFDEIRLRDAYPPAYSGFYDGTMNALGIDSIELGDLVPVELVEFSIE